MKKLILGAALIVFGLPGVSWAASDAEKIMELEKKLAKAEKQAAIVSAEIRTFSNALYLRPNIPKDFTKASGEYCFFGGWKGHHTHYSTDPTKTQEDVIDFVAAEQMIAAGAKVEDFPKYPGIIGEMKPGQWYYSPAKAFEPHHGKTPPIALLIRAVDIK